MLSHLLRSHIIRMGLSTEEYGRAQGWRRATAYNKVYGRSEHSATEIAVARRLLELSDEEVARIFLED